MHDKGFKALLAMLCTVLWLAAAAHAQQTPTAGDLVINEIMYNPSTTEPDTEWFEVKNVSGNELDINGCTISDGEDTHTISGASPITAGDYFVFGYSNSITGVTVDYAYGPSNIRLANTGDQITITCEATTIDTVSYGDSSPWPSSVNGWAIAFGVPTGGGTDYATLNDDGNNWEHSTSQIGGGNTDLGTPGARNDDVLGPNAITLSTFAANAVEDLSAAASWPLAALAGIAALTLPWPLHTWRRCNSEKE